MATLPTSSSSSSKAFPHPLLRFPLIISESLRSAVSSDGSATQGIISILLSGADLAKLDLSKLQLFSVNGLAMDTPSSPQGAPPMASSELTPSPVDVIPPDYEFDFQTPLILSPAGDLPPGTAVFPVLKSKGVVDAEKASAEHHLLKLGAVSPSPHARKKAVSMDEISLNEQLSSLDMVPPTQVHDDSRDFTGARNRAKAPLPALQVAALPCLCPGLEQKAETLKKKHFERILSRTLSEVGKEEAKIDLKASPAAKFLLQVMPWELTPPITPITTPAAIPFIWEDVPGKPKPRGLPSPCPSLPLPPRLLPAPPSSSSAGPLPCPSSDAPDLLPAHVDGKQVYSTVKGRRTHRKNVHSWHVLHNMFSGGSPSHLAEAGIESDQIFDRPGFDREQNDLPHAGGERNKDAASSSTSINTNSASSELSFSTATVSEDVISSSDPMSLSARYTLPPLYVAPIVPLTPPYKDLGPLGDDHSKHTNRLSYMVKFFRRKGGQRRGTSKIGSFLNRFNKHGKVSSESNSYLLDEAMGYNRESRAGHGVYVDEATLLRKKNQSISAQLSPLASTLYRSPKANNRSNHKFSRSGKVFVKLRRRGGRVIVAAYRAIKRALFLRRTSQSKHTQLPYHTL